MDERVLRVRHVARLQLFAHFCEPALFFLQAVRTPLIHVEVAPSAVDLAHDHPRNWRDVTVPRPLREIRVAVRAGALDVAITCGGVEVTAQIVPTGSRVGLLLSTGMN